MSQSPDPNHSFRQLSDAGNALRADGKIDEAIACFRRAVALNASFVVAHVSLGELLSEKGRAQEGLSHLRTAVALDPQSANAYNALGRILLQMLRANEASKACERAIALKPDLAEAHSTLGETLRLLERFPEAEAACRRAVELAPESAVAHANLGNALAHLRRFDDANASYEKAISLQPDNAAFHYGLANGLFARGRVADAIQSLRRTLVLCPDFVDAHSRLLLLMNLQEGVSSADIGQESRAWNARHAARFAGEIRPYGNSRDANRKLRIGYVSADFHEHACAHFLHPLYVSHDREQFEVVTYAYDRVSDDLTERFRKLSTAWRSTVGRGAGAIAEQVRADGIDILVDLKLHTDNNHLLVFARKPAPVQITWLGYPGTTGLTAIDYRLTDPYLDPPGVDESAYSEKTIRLPETFWCYDPLANEPDVSSLPAIANGHVTFGCLNHFSKISESTLALWSRVLRVVERSRFLIQVPEGLPQRRVLDSFQAHGIDSGRIEFLPSVNRAEYLKLYHQIDIGLDTLPYNGHTTNLDAMWMGVPVITMPGQTIGGRAGAGHLTNVSLPEMIARTPEQFVEIASRLAGDLPRLAELRSKLRAKMQVSPLMDGPRFAHNVEAIYRRVWQTWCSSV